MSEKIEDAARETARGQDEATPARALAGVHIVILAVAGILIVALTLLWWFLSR